MFLDNVHIWLLFCIIELSPAFVDGMVSCVQTMISGRVPEPSDFHGRIVPVFSVMLSESLTINTDFWPCPLCTEISPDSMKHLMILCTVDYKIFKVFPVLY